MKEKIGGKGGKSVLGLWRKCEGRRREVLVLRSKGLYAGKGGKPGRSFGEGEKVERFKWVWLQYQTQ